MTFCDSAMRQSRRSITNLPAAVINQQGGREHRMNQQQEQLTISTTDSSQWSSAGPSANADHPGFEPVALQLHCVLPINVINFLSKFS